MIIFILFQVICLGIFIKCEDLDTLQEDFWNWKIALNPEYATQINLYKYNNLLDSYNYTGFEDIKEHVDRYIQRLSRIDYNYLTPSEKVNYDMLNDNLQTVMDGYQWRFHNGLNPINFLRGPQIDPKRFVDTIPFNNKGDFENYLSRLQLFPKQIDEIIESFNEGIRRKFTYHNVSIAEVPGQIEKLLDTNSKDYLYTTFEKPFNEILQNLTDIPEKENTHNRFNILFILRIANMKTAAHYSIVNVVYAFRKLKNYIENTYMKHLRAGTGVNLWENGEDYYRACLQWHLSLPLTPEEVHNKGLEEVERVYGKMQKIMNRSNFKGTVKEFYKSLNSDPKCDCYNKSKEYILKELNDIVHNRIEKKMPLLFKDIPNLPVVVEERPNDGPRGSYIPGTVDGSRPGVFLINLFRPAQMSTYRFMSLAIHETNPGHHLQLSIEKTADLPKFRKFPFSYRYNVPFAFPEYTSYVEGRALYAESLGEELGLYKDDYELMGRYSSGIFRACRLVVDTGLHYYNWTREKAIDYMLNYTSINEADANNEIDRYITWPGQACAYKIGELKFLELKQKAENELGKKFDIKDFHSAVLKPGSMPLSLLEKVVDIWIKEVKSSSHPKNNAPDMTNMDLRIGIYIFSVFIILTSYAFTSC